MKEICDNTSSPNQKMGKRDYELRMANFKVIFHRCSHYNIQ